MLFEIENIVWMNMADSSTSKQAQRYNEKLKSLNDLITNLQDQAKKLEAKKNSKQRGTYPNLVATQIPEINTSIAFKELHQQGCKEIQKSEKIQSKGQLQIDNTDVSFVVSKDSDVTAKHVVSYGRGNRLGLTAQNINETVPNQGALSSQRAQSSQRRKSSQRGKSSQMTRSSQTTRHSQRTEPMQKTGSEQVVKTMGLIDSNTDKSDTRLSRLAKEVWNRKTEKLLKVRCPVFRPSYRSQRYTRAIGHSNQMELLEKDPTDLGQSIYKVDNVKSRLLIKSLPDYSNSPFSFVYPYNHKSLKNLQGTKNKYIKDMHWSSGSMSRENDKRSSASGIQNNVKSPTGSSLSSFGGGVASENGALDTPNSLKTSSDRLSSLARETWKKSIFGRSSSRRRLNKFFTAKGQRPTRNTTKFDSHGDIFSKSNVVMEKNSNDNLSYADLSTNDRLSDLAKKIWQNRAISKSPSKHFTHRSLKRRRSMSYPLNVSKPQNRFIGPASKFIWRSNEERVNSFLNRRRRAVLKQSRFKLVRENGVKRSVSNRGKIQKRTKKGKEPKILFTNLQGKKFVTDTRGRRLVRFSLSSLIPSHGRNPTESLQGSPLFPLARRKSVSFQSASRYKIVRRQSITQNASSKVATANRMVKKSLFHLHQQTARKFVKKQYCMFYNRFGKCKNGSGCRYIHDPEKVAVCTRYLRGTCKDENCLFSHKIDSKKMPTCVFFLNGVCHRENCPYAHVKVSGTAEICKDFLKGYCPSGDKCLKRHMLECEEFSKRGSCSEGDRCKLYHRKRNLKRRRSSSISGTKAPRPFTKRIKSRRNSDELLNLKGTTENELKIKPSFTFVENIEVEVTGMKRLKRKRRFDWKRETEHE